MLWLDVQPPWTRVRRYPTNLVNDLKIELECSHAYSAVLLSLIEIVCGTRTNSGIKSELSSSQMHLFLATVSVMQ